MDYRDLENKLEMDSCQDNSYHKTFPFGQQSDSDMYSTNQRFTYSTLEQTECTVVQINNNSYNQDENKKYSTLKFKDLQPSHSPNKKSKITFLQLFSSIFV